ncbi:MAG: Rdx family protein [Actinobacteria bacterium]|nr:Rdx family protein [Actinomycetota bacterium]
MTDEILSGWAPLIAAFELVPASGGRFELTLDDELVFSKKNEGRHAEPGEIVALVRERLGDEVMPED